jgi:hypothetical protein
LPNKKSENLPFDHYGPKWDGVKFIFVKRDMPDHKAYNQLFEKNLAKASAKASEASLAKPKAVAELVCAVPPGSRILLFQNRLFIAMSGQQPVELVNGQLQELRLATIAAAQRAE